MKQWIGKYFLDKSCFLKLLSMSFQFVSSSSLEATSIIFNVSFKTIALRKTPQ